jgi:hypothetical protein
MSGLDLSGSEYALMAGSYKHFHFGVLHPVECALSRLSEVPSLATTFRGVYCTYTSTATCLHNNIYNKICTIYNGSTVGVITSLYILYIVSST